MLQGGPTWITIPSKINSKPSKKSWKINETTLKQSTKKRTKINQISTKSRPKIDLKTIKNLTEVIPGASRGEFAHMVGSRNLSRSPPVDFLPDFWHHLGTSQALNGSQNDAKIVHKSMPKSSQNVKPLEKAPRRPKTAPRRPQADPKTA